MLTLDESARLIGGHAWVELRLFELVGGWVASVPEPEVKALIAVHARHHAWHGELWLGHRPRVAGRDPDELVAPPGEGMNAALRALDVPAGPGATLARLVGLYRVLLPRLVTAYDRHLAACSPVADGPVMRSLRLVLADDVADWRAGEALVQTRIGTGDDARRAAEHQAHVETIVADAGGITGQGPPA